MEIHLKAIPEPISFFPDGAWEGRHVSGECLLQGNCRLDSVSVGASLGPPLGDHVGHGDRCPACPPEGWPFSNTILLCNNIHSHLCGTLTPE